MKIEQNLFGGWIVAHPTERHLAWSGSRWVPHEHGIPTGGVQVSSYETREAAERAAKEIWPEWSPYS